MIKAACLAGFALVVIGDQLHFLAVDPARRVDFLDGQLDAVVGRNAKRGLGTGHGTVVTNQDFIGRSRRPGSGD